MFITVDWSDSKFDSDCVRVSELLAMTYWMLISTGDPVQTGDPVGSDRITTSPARAGTGEPLHRLEPVPVRQETNR